MSSKKSSKLVSEKVIPNSALKEKNLKALEIYKQYQEAADIIEQTAIALGRKTVFRTQASSTLNCEINHRAIASTKETYKI